MKSQKSSDIKATAEDWFSDGLYIGRLGDYDKAISFFLKAIELDPNFAKAYNNLCFAYYKKFDFTKAIKFYKKAIEIDPDLSEPYFNLGNAYNNVTSIGYHKIYL